MLLRQLFLIGGIGATLLRGGASTPLPVEPEGVATGRVVLLELDSAAAGSFAMMLVDEERNGRSPDGTVDRVLRLQLPHGALKGVAREFAYARVSWAHGGATLQAAGTARVSFAIGDVEAAPAEMQYRGFGLSQTRSWPLSIKMALGEGEYASLRNDIRKLFETCLCTSGGPGASGCSVNGCSGTPSSCSVSCNSPYLPCCGCSDGTGKACCLCYQDGGGPEQ